jgi:thiamine biosynthesis lipoprotein
MSARAALALTALLALFPGCQRTPVEAPPKAAPAAPAAPTTVELRGETMGTTYLVKIVVQDAPESAKVVALKAAVDAILENVNDVMSTYRPKSELSRFNQRASTAPFPASTELRRVVGRALEIGAQTDGAFDVTLGPVIDVWGFDAKGKRTSPPTSEEIAAARARTGRDKVAVEGEALVKRVPELQVNLSGIAKGWGVDEVHRLVVEQGFRDVMVEIGGEVRASGHSAKGEPWRLGVNVPKAGADPTAVLRKVSLADRALATSGDYRNYFESGGKRYSHIIDPRTAAPIEHEIVSATVVAADCTTADGLATASMVLGAEAAKALLEKMDGVEGFFVEKKGGELRTLHTAGFPSEG